MSFASAQVSSLVALSVMLMMTIIIMASASASAYPFVTQDSTDRGSWTVLPTLYNGAPRHHPITFTLNGVGYLMAGVEGVFDVFTYNATTRTWTNVLDSSSASYLMDDSTVIPPWREYGYGVRVGSVDSGEPEVAYLGLGLGDAPALIRDTYPRIYLDDWWMFDPVSNNFTQRASIPLARYHPAMVAVDSGGDRGWSVYVGLGGSFEGNMKDWYEYSVNEDRWTKHDDLPGPARHHPFYWDARVGQKHFAYVGFGHGANEDGRILKDVYRYDPEMQQWTRMRDFPGEARVAGTQFTLTDKTTGRDRPFILSGDGDDHGSIETGELWEYLPMTDEWVQHPSHPGHSRWAPGSFVIDCDVYFTSGYDRYTQILHHDLMQITLC